MVLIGNRILFDCLIFAACGLKVTLGQNPSSPCPDVFSYRQDGDGWYGLITGRSPSYGNEIKTVVHMIYDGILTNDNIGNIVRLTSDEEVPQVVARSGSLRYRLNLNVRPLPRLSKVEFNGRVVCESQRDESHFGSVTTLSREHTLYPNGNPKKYTASSTPRPTASLDRFHPVEKQFDPTAVPTPRPAKDRFRPVVGWAQQTPPYPVPPASTSTARSAAPAAHASLVQCGIHGQEPTIAGLIAQGRPTQPGEWPWLVALFHSSLKGIEFQCGATLLNNRFVVTAAHCIYNTKTQEQVEVENVVIMVGARDVSLKTLTEDLRALSVMYVHEEYDTVSNLNDIALLVLEEPVIYSKLVKPVCLWDGNDDQDNLDGQKGTVVGWGDTGKGPSLEEPLFIDVPIVSLTTCRGTKSIYHDLTNNKSLCAGNNDRTGPCNGDSGSGLFVEHNNRWRLRGLVSATLDFTCGPSSYVIYTDVAKFRDWINEKFYEFSLSHY